MSEPAPCNCPETPSRPDLADLIDELERRWDQSNGPAPLIFTRTQAESIIASL